MLLLGLGALVVCGGAALALLRDPAPASAPSLGDLKLANLKLADLGRPQRPLPGVEYAPSVTLPRETLDQLQKWSTDFKRAKVEKPDNRAIQKGFTLNWLEPGNPFGEGLGLRPADRILAVHGQPEGQPIVLGEEALDALLNERWFAVLVEREGKRVVLSYVLP